MPPEWRKLRGYGALEHTPLSELVEISARVLERGLYAPGTGGQLKLKRLEGPVSRRPPADAVFWKTKLRSFTVAELEGRKVSRKDGLAILRLAAEAGKPLPPSSIAYALLGVRSAAYATRDPQLLSLRFFGAGSGRKYDELLADILAMCVKGYLCSSRERGKRFELSTHGRDVLSQSRE